MRIRSKQRRRSGTAIVEMALVGPVCLLFILGCMDMSTGIWAYDNLAEAVREGGRYATIHGAKYQVWYNGPPPPPSGTPKPTGPAANNTDIDAIVRSYSFVTSANL